MDLSYNPGELDYKNVQEITSSLKREQDSVDDFEHLDPETSPTDKKSKLVSDLDSNYQNPDVVEKTLAINEKVNLDSNSHDHTAEFSKNLQLKENMNITSQPSLFVVENVDENAKKISQPDPNAQSSGFISAEKALHSFKSDLESDLIGLETNVKDVIEGIDAPNEEICKFDQDKSTPVISMKEADAMAHYSIKQDKKETEKVDGSLDKEQDTIAIIPKTTPEIVDKPTLNEGLQDPSTIVVDGDKNNHKDKGAEIKKNVSSFVQNEDTGKLKFTSASPELEPVAKPQTPTEQIKSKQETVEDVKEFPQTDNNQSRVYVSPTKPDSPKLNDLDDIIGPEDVFKRIGLVEALIYWRNPKKSGVVFGGVMTILLSLCFMSLISVVAYTLMLTIIATFSYRTYKDILQAIQKNGEGHPFKNYLEMDLTFVEEKVREITDPAILHINAAIAELRRLILVEDYIDSLKFLLCLWSFTYIGAIFNGITLVILGFVALFTVPKIYENNKTSIDTYIEMGRSKVAEITSKVKAAVPIGKKEAEEKTKDKEQ